MGVDAMLARDAQALASGHTRAVVGLVDLCTGTAVLLHRSITLKYKFNITCKFRILTWVVRL